MDHRVKPGGDETRYVIAGLDPAIHAADASAWTTGSSPVVTKSSNDDAT
jgi:hypothetical protein